MLNQHFYSLLYLDYNFSLVVRLAARYVYLLFLFLDEEFVLFDLLNLLLINLKERTF